MWNTLTVHVIVSCGGSGSPPDKTDTATPDLPPSLGNLPCSRRIRGYIRQNALRTPWTPGCPFLSKATSLANR